MRRITKKLLIFSIGIGFVVIYCEFLIYYVVTAQCSWPELPASGGTQELKALIIADTHLLGPYRGHWLDKWRREWQMQQAYRSIMTLHRPEAVFVLGDLFDEGEWTNDIQFQDYVQRFYKLFQVDDGVTMQVVVGNHDIGFHSKIWPGSVERFNKALNSSSVKFVTIKGNHFILLNSMAMHGDSCRLCREAMFSLNRIAKSLECSKNPSECTEIPNFTYSQPILMQHFPLYRISDAQCTEPDAPPLPLRNKKFRNRIDSLSQEATDYLTRTLKPRAVFGGHTHHGCLVHHKDKDVDFYEYSVPSFSWRNRPDPKYMLVTISPNSYAINKCGLPKEATIAVTAVILVFAVSYYTFKIRLLGRS
ncbi:metallophosphoesterase 1 homolog [Leguminivora glycinivorella]|uniref:metallophosphoesterase 1 homolog n=1 Tax=Leguminivora glycinivorella TaxID=1035111 RepID=UPI00200E5E30|nr:metallophosphoesterase 1 homolog [Leguminivora glycinivorella]